MASWTLQQLSTLQSSTVSHDKKLEACQEVSDKLNENILKGETRATALAKMSLGRYYKVQRKTQHNTCMQV